MTDKQLMRAAWEAISLARALQSRLPAGCHVPPEELFIALWPLACRLAWMEHRARKNAKDARRYRKIRAVVAEELRTRPDSLVPLAALARTVPMDADVWKMALVPGVSADALEAA
jgi:hypothetical protein